MFTRLSDDPSTNELLDVLFSEIQFATGLPDDGLTVTQDDELIVEDPTNPFGDVRRDDRAEIRSIVEDERVKDRVRAVVRNGKIVIRVF